MKINNYFLIALLLLPVFSLAFDATSTSFYIRQNIQSISGTSSSATFQNLGAGGQISTGTSSANSYTASSGILYLLYLLYKPSFEQIHYHWRNDDGSETTATSATGNAEDTSLSNLNIGTTKRLRLEISNEGASGIFGNPAANQNYRLEYGLKTGSACSDIVTWTDVGAAEGDWDMVASQLVEAADTTNIAVAIGGVTDANPAFKTPNGGQRETASQTGNISLSSEEFLEAEYSIKALTGASDANPYCFRLTNAGSVTNFTYTRYPEVQLAPSLTFTIDTASVSFPSLTPGSAVATSSILTVTTSNSTGFNISIKRNDSDTTLDLTSDASININDKTVWSAPLATTTPGNSAVYSGTDLGFRIKLTGTDTANYASVWWGTNDESVNALYAGLPSADQIIVDRSVSSSPGTNSVAEYKLNVSNSQLEGDYNGVITFTVVVNP